MVKERKRGFQLRWVAQVQLFVKPGGSIENEPDGVDDKLRVGKPRRLDVADQMVELQALGLVHPRVRHPDPWQCVAGKPLYLCAEPVRDACAGVDGGADETFRQAEVLCDVGDRLLLVCVGIQQGVPHR